VRGQPLGRGRRAAPQGAVEPADDAPLVVGGPLAQRRGVIDVRELPELERLPCRAGVEPVEAQLDRQAAGGDQQQRGGRDARDGVHERRTW